ncbi:MAG: plasmid stabilization protein [Planctomycetes bacterium RBG_16_55_9]|nr:MAG: plasmid stabilization protein [Planctomycetes bacterium RBG_16_55_9]
MKFDFHPDAEQELNQAVDYYNDCQPLLGWDFAREVYFTIQNIVTYPKAWTPLSKNARRCLVNRFPFGVIYQIVRNDILIIAVMHLNRKPGYWQSRIAN